MALTKFNRLMSLGQESAVHFENRIKHTHKHILRAK